MPAKSNKASSRKKIETVLPLERILKVFHSRFGDPFGSPLAFLTSQDFAETFTDIPKNHVEEALLHYANYASEKILKTEIIEIDGRVTRVWPIRGSRKGQDFESGDGGLEISG